jgi:diguanylate cyclase (GGDEF)-like protein
LGKFAAFLLCLLGLFVCAPASATAPAHGVTLGQPCLRLGGAEARPETLLFSAKGFDCTRDPRTAEAETVWVRYDLRHHRIDGHDGWSYVHTLVQAKNEQVWVGYADGRIRKSATNQDAARKILAGPTQHYALGSESGQITSLLVRLDGMENRRGPVPRAHLSNDARTAERQAQYFLIFGLLAGIVAGILVYNMTLYVALRYEVLAAYCSSLAATLFYGLVNSHGILWFAPGLSTASQFGLNAFAIMIGFLTTSLYLKSFVEPGMIPRLVIKAMIAISLVAAAFALTRVFTQVVSWRVFDGLVYLAMASAILLLFVAWGFALKRGSVAVRFFIAAWSLPLAATISRMLWGTGQVTQENALFDALTFVALCTEGLLSSVALSWRLRKLRHERDFAKDQADELYDLANKDPLTGIANRRCFHGRALWEGARNETVQLLLVDVDQFKFVNDGHGHDVGDAVLIRVANAVAASGAEVIGRLGGDEFALITSHGNAAELARTIERHLLMNMAPNDLGVTLSMGIASGPLRNEQDWQLLYIASDRALYQSKREGRARVTDASATQIDGEGTPQAA